MPAVTLQRLREIVYEGLQYSFFKGLCWFFHNLSRPVRVWFLDCSTEYHCKTQER